MVMIFLGAGASKVFGIPTAKRFIYEFEKELEKKHENEKLLYNDIKGQLMEKIGPDIDIEDILTVLNDLCDPANPTITYLNQKFSVYAKKAPLSKPKIPKDVRRKLLRFIRKRCDIKNQHQKIVDIYDPFFDIFDDPFDIFTTNYDCSVEIYFDEKHITLVDGFPPMAGEWKPELFDDEENIGKNKLFKLHGSIYQYEKNGEILKIPSAKVGDINNLMVYPMRDKNVYNEPFFELYNRLKTALKTARLCVVVGHSFRDRTIRNMFINAVKKRGYFTNRMEILSGTNYAEARDLKGWEFKISDFYFNQYLSPNMHDPIIGELIDITYYNPKEGVERAAITVVSPQDKAEECPSIFHIKGEHILIENKSSKPLISLKVTEFGGGVGYNEEFGELVEECANWAEIEVREINDPEGLLIILIDPDASNIREKRLNEIKSNIIPINGKFGSEKVYSELKETWLAIKKLVEFKKQK